MANKNLLKKIAPVILSATVAMTGMPSAAFYTICGRGQSGRYRGSSGSRSLSGDSGVIDDRSRKKCRR